MAVSYLPYASERGAVLFTSARVDRVILTGDRATGVVGHFHRPQWKQNIAPFRLHARQGVLVAASAIQTPGLLARSGVRSRHLGRHFQGHPGASLVGIFDGKVRAWSGATQGYASDHYRQNGSFKIETLALAPEVLFARLPGIGRAWVGQMAAAAHMAIWAVQVRAHTQGTVFDRRSGTQIRFDLEPQDVTNLRRGLRVGAELMFAAGAREVLPGVHGLPASLTNVDQVSLLETGPGAPACYSLAMTHLFGTARMSRRPADGVVDPDFAVHGTSGFYVIDSSLFPTNLGVNPQHTIMAVAMHAARRIASLG
jgi:choline dehydrogenase-like flavoprotein